MFEAALSSTSTEAQETFMLLQAVSTSLVSTPTITTDMCSPELLNRA